MNSKSSQKLRLVLASQSPRRSELLARAGFRFTITSPQISEIPDENLNLQDQIRQIAIDKALACLSSGKVAKGEGNLILSADTVVVQSDKILGKPRDVEECAEYLRRLSGQTHRVITAVCLVEVDAGRRAVAHETSYVTFRQLSESEIFEYAASGDGLDKAGGYGIQGTAAQFVASIEGPVDNVMGLPVAVVEGLIAENGWVLES